MSSEAHRGDRHPGWTEIRPFVAARAPSLHVIDGAPRLTLSFPGNNAGLEIRIPMLNGAPELRPLAEVEIRLVRGDEGPELRISTGTEALFPYLYEFALVVADRVQIDRTPPAEAVAEAMASWRRLLQSASMLSAERQTGLMGELLTLRRLEATMGAPALDAWVGPAKQAHDFRMGNVEIEVKTTRGETRAHTINGSAQLEASPGCHLHILSIQLAAAGADAGESLYDLIVDLRARFAGQAAADRFSAVIESACGIPSALEPHYRERLKLRSPMWLIPVDEDLPRISASDVQAIQRPEMSRVSDLRFRLDVTGLGSEDGSAPFFALLPAAPVR